MSNEVEEVKLSTLSCGVADELFNREFKKVLENISDINTDAKASRSITLKITIKPNDSRENGDVSVKASSTLCPAKEHKTPIYFSQLPGGQPIAYQSQKVQFGSIFENVQELQGGKKC